MGTFSGISFKFRTQVLSIAPAFCRQLEIRVRKLIHILTTLGLVSAFVASSAFADQKVPTTVTSGMGHGINALGYDPMWKDPDQARFKPGYYRMLKVAGFSFIRVPLIAFGHMDEDGTLDPQWLATLDDVVKRATDAGLAVILDEHDYHICGTNPDLCHRKLVSFWSQIAPRYKNAPQSVMFELMNEANTKMTPDKWNVVLADLLKLVRKTNPHRRIVIGPADYDSFKDLDKLKLPADDHNILVTIHYYDPFRFTYQGAAWVKPSRKNDIGHKWGSDQDRKKVEQDFAKMAAWSRKTGRPVIIGEFGTYNKGDMASRARWTATVARTAEKHKFAWCYWQFDYDFNAFDEKKGEWVTPLYQALFPPKKPAGKTTKDLGKQLSEL